MKIQVIIDTAGKIVSVVNAEPIKLKDGSLTRGVIRPINKEHTVKEFDAPRDLFKMDHDKLIEETARILKTSASDMS